MKVIIVRGSALDPAVNKIADCLSRNGCEVELLLWNRQDTQNQQNSGYTIKNFHFRAPQNNAWVFLFFPIWWAYELVYLLRSDANVIHACDLDTLYPAIIAKIIKKSSLVYTIYDFYANNIPTDKLTIITKPFRFLIEKFEKFGIGFSNLLILSDESRCEEVQGASIHNLVYIYNSPPDIYNPLSQNFDVRKDRRLTIFYTGPINRTRGIQHMIEAVDGLPGVSLILGGIIDDVSNDKQFFETIIKANNNVQYIGWIPTYQEVLQKTAEADILFRFSAPHHPKTKYESPNKLFEAMMVGKPIIVSDESSMANIVKNTNCGCVVPFGDISSIVRVIERLRDDPALCQKFGLNGRKAYNESYNWSIMETRLVAAYKEMINAG